MRIIILILLCLLLLPDVFGQEGQSGRVFLRDIHVSGNSRTRQAVILRELSVQPHTIISKDSIGALEEECRLRLMTIQLFNEVKVAFVREHADTASLYITVLERFPVIPDPHFEFADRNFNVWWTEQHRDLRRLNLGLSLVHRNFRGNREQLSLTAQLGYTQKFAFAYERPFLDKQQRWGAGISIAAQQNKEIAYRTYNNKLDFHRSFDHAMMRQSQAGAWLTYRPHYAGTHRLTLLFTHYWLADTIVAMNPEFLGNGQHQENTLLLQYTYRHNRVDNWEYPLTGYRLIGSFSQLYATGSRKGLTGFYLQADKYIQPARQWYASLIFRGRLSFPQRQPYILRRNMGYDFDYVRGYQYYVSDGDAFALLRLNLKRELLNVKLKLPLRYFQVIPLRVYAKAFADAGLTHGLYNDNDALRGKPLYAGGIGLDIMTLYDIKIRLEYTVNRMGEKALYLHKSGE